MSLKKSLQPLRARGFLRFALTPKARANTQAYMRANVDTVQSYDRYNLGFKTDQSNRFSNLNSLHQGGLYSYTLRVTQAEV
jgi:uncharacterized protein with NRDE domain